MQFKKIKELSTEAFADVVLYTIAEPGAMGAPCLMEFVKANGECFYLFYGEDGFPYADIKTNFPALQGCFWNGSMRGEKNKGEVVVFATDDETNSNMTRVANGWEHVYTGYGNHLVVKDAFFPIFNKYISRYETTVDIYCSLQKHIDDFINELKSK